MVCDWCFCFILFHFVFFFLKKRKLERMRNVDQDVVKRLAGANILNVEDLLQHTIIELVQTSNLNLHEPVAMDLMRVVCEATA
jgi:hypothetical protein